MNFDWQDFLNLAQVLLKEVKQPNPLWQEAKYRTAVSRLYYGVFHHARERILKENPTLKIPKGGTHTFVSTYFEQSQDANRILIGKKLKEFQALRNQADYEKFWVTDIKALETNSATALRLAQEIINLLATL